MAVTSFDITLCGQCCRWPTPC